MVHCSVAVLVCHGVHCSVILLDLCFVLEGEEKKGSRMNESIYGGIGIFSTTGPTRVTWDRPGSSQSVLETRMSVSMLLGVSEACSTM